MDISGEKIPENVKELDVLWELATFSMEFTVNKLENVYLFQF